MRSLTLLDYLIDQMDQSLRTSYAPARARRANPADDIEDGDMDETERRHAAGLMRINHVGEVCAQALYNGQSLTADHAEIRQQMIAASEEETDHLAWCNDRLEELSSRPSLFNPFWYAGSWTLGAVAGLCGDDWSLGFVVETERQVEAHLHEHLESLPEGDNRSRAIVTQMAIDEAEHGQNALDAGGRELPRPIQRGMTIMASFMKLVAYRA